MPHRGTIAACSPHANLTTHRSRCGPSHPLPPPLYHTGKTPVCSAAVELRVECPSPVTLNGAALSPPLSHRTLNLCEPEICGSEGRCRWKGIPRASTGRFPQPGAARLGSRSPCGRARCPATGSPGRPASPGVRRRPAGGRDSGPRSGCRASRYPDGSGGEPQHPAAAPRRLSATAGCSRAPRRAPRPRPGAAGAFHPRPCVRVGRRARPPGRGPGFRPWAGVRGGKTKPSGSPAPPWQSPMPRCFHLFLICLIKRLLMALTIVLV